MTTECHTHIPTPNVFLGLFVGRLILARLVGHLPEYSRATAVYYSSLMKSEEPKPLTIPQMVDELGQIEAEIGPIEISIKHRVRRAEALRKAIGLSVNILPELPTIVTGATYSATVGPKENKTTITSMAGVFRALKQGRFLDYCSFSTEKLRVLLGDDAEKYLESKRIGSRSVETFLSSSVETKSAAA